MNCSVREMVENDIELVVDYFINSSAEFLKGMGADKSKLPKRNVWINNIKAELDKPYKDKNLYYMIWLLDGQPVGHSNINHVTYGKTATMHLHLWKSKKRKSGLGIQFVKKSIPYYFKNFQLETLNCEPYAENPAPNKILPKLGFTYNRSYLTTPGTICFPQMVNKYQLTKGEFIKD